MKKAFLLFACMVVSANVYGSNKAAADQRNVKPLSANAIASSGASVTPANLSTTGGVWKKVNFTSSDAQYDTDSYIGTDRFTAPDDGIYILTMKGVVDNTGGSNIEKLNFAYSVNGGTLGGLLGITAPIGDTFQGNASIQLQLNAGDYVEAHMLTYYNKTLQQIIVGIARM